MMMGLELMRGQTAGECGKDLAEYALLVMFIAVTAFATVTLLGVNLDNYWQAIAGLWPEMGG